jgi:hypothetical protein
MKVDGSCHCGKITYQADVDPESSQVCHCTDCQTLSGSPWRASVGVKAADFHLLTGQPKIYVKTSEDGTPRSQGFCGDCGSPLYSAAVKDTPLYFLRLGAIKQRALLPPKRQIWHRSALPWASNVTGLPVSELD